jgi:ABC-type transporter Mla subunit MlaD
MQRSSSILWKTGAFVLVGIVVATVTLFTIRNPLLMLPGYEIDVWLDSANGLLVGTPVKVAGVEVGEVRGVALDRDSTQPERPPVRVTVWLPETVEVYDDDLVLIGMLGILGEKYIEIIPGLQQGEVIQSGHSLIAQAPVTEAEMIQQLASTLDEFEEALVMVNAFDLNPEPLLDLKADLEVSLEKANTLIDEVQDAVKISLGKVDPVLDQFKSVGEQSEQLFEDIRRWTPWVGAGLAALLLIVALI